MPAPSPTADAQPQPPSCPAPRGAGRERTLAASLRLFPELTGAGFRARPRSRAVFASRRCVPCGSHARWTRLRSHDPACSFSAAPASDAREVRMLLTASAQQAVQELAQRYGVSTDAVTTLLSAVSL